MVDFNPLFKWIGSLGITSIIVALIENKYHIINRIRKGFALIKNSGTEASLSLEYKITNSFEEILGSFKNRLRNEVGFKVVKKTNTSAKLEYGTISLNLIHNSKGNLFIELERMGCGIRDLKENLNIFLGKINEFEKDKIIKEFIGCDLSFTLPYKWDNLNIWVPKGLEVKRYNVVFSDSAYKSDVEISVNKVNIKSNALQSINYLVGKFV